MIIKRLLILQAVLVLGLGLVFAIPSNRGVGKAGITLALPADVGMWSSKELPITEQELRVLAGDTGFARRLYTNPFGDEISVGIVLSGEDMTSSIHRPERCLPAQGWTVERSVRTKVPLATGASLEASKLSTVAERKIPDGKVITFHNLTYYWFIGSTDVTASHLTRTMIDIKDRILRGENQRWAYVTVQATVTKGLTKFGRSEQETAKLMEDLIGQVVPRLQRPAESAG